MSAISSQYPSSWLVAFQNILEGSWYPDRQVQKSVNYLHILFRHWKQNLYAQFQYFLFALSTLYHTIGILVLYNIINAWKSSRKCSWIYWHYFLLLYFFRCSSGEYTHQQNSLRSIMSMAQTEGWENSKRSIEKVFSTLHSFASMRRWYRLLWRRSEDMRRDADASRRLVLHGEYSYI